MHGHFMSMFKDLDFKMENQGKKLVITLEGEAEKMKSLEKKLNAMKDLCEDGCGCCDEGHGCC
jgi:hypothetical protein